MLKSFRLTSKGFAVSIQKRYFLTNDYKCNETWNSVNSSPIINKINLNDFYNKLDQNYSSKGVISAIDVDIFANATKDTIHLEELKDLLHKLRLSADTVNTLDSTHHATVRNFIKFGQIRDLITILKDPLNFGVFLDNFSANMLLDELLTQQNYELAANVASLIMLQEDYTNNITCTLCQYSCYKYITSYVAPEPVLETTVKNKKVEEKKIRVKFLRNPYFDDHFDIKDLFTLSGKTLAWLSEPATDNLNINLQAIGWLIYKKYDKLLNLCEHIEKTMSFKLYGEVLELLQKEKRKEIEKNSSLEKCFSILDKAEKISTDITLDKSLQNAIENAINKTQNNDIQMQMKLFKSWENIREKKLEEQTIRLNRARRIQFMQEKQKELEDEEQKLWFFENEEKIDLEIEEKEKLLTDVQVKKTVSKTIDENYVPPEIRPKRK